MGLPSLPGAGAPVCPVCEGPCTHPWAGAAGPSPYRLFDRLRHHHADGTVTDPAEEEPPPPPEKPKRGKRSKHGPAEDRAHHPNEDREERKEA